MKILFIAHYFQPEPNMFFGLPFAEELIRRGHQVEVLTGFPNYPGGKIYPGYRQKLKMVESINGVRVTRVPLYPSHDKSSLKRIISYSSLAFSKSLIGAFTHFAADVAYVVQGPATIGLPSMVFKCMKGIPYVYHIQDMWPDSLRATGMFNSALGMKILHSWCNTVYRQADRIAVIAPGMKKLLVERGVQADKVEVLYNWCDEKNMHSGGNTDPALIRELFDHNYFNILYAGNIGNAQALDTVIRAAMLLRSEKRIRFILVGEGVDKSRLVSKVAELRLTNVLFHSRIPADQVGGLLKHSDVVLAHLKHDPLFDITIPSKIQAYMAAGKPILAGCGHDAAELIKRAGAGVVFEPENSKSMADAAAFLSRMQSHELEQMGRRSADFYQKELSFEIGVSHFEQLFETARMKQP